MPITPLHFGVLAPFNHWKKFAVSNIAFILTTLWMDATAILYYAFGVDGMEFHTPETHSFLGALFLSSVVAVCGFRSLRWMAGAYLGGFTHVLLDSFVHADVLPFYPDEGNPFYWGGMGWVSLILCLPFIWLISQYVHWTYSGISHKLRNKLND